NTRRYTFKNVINVIDVGMRIGDIAGLQREASGIKISEYDAARKNLRDNGATPVEIDFLLEERVELNAFTSAALVAWIEGKLVENGVKKIIPTEASLAAAYRRACEQNAVQTLIDDAVKEWRKSTTVNVV